MRRVGREVLIERLGVHAEDLPILICPNGTVLRRPSDAEAGVGLGIVPDQFIGAESQHPMARSPYCFG
jgi:hypothetical protein